MRKSLLYTIFIFISVILYSCANIGNPSGGPRDEDPPIFMHADPAQGSTKVTKTKMTLTFNEIVNVKDAFNKVVISPVAKSIPRVTANGRRVTVQFDSLSPDVTYTVDFADAIEDNNESNKLSGFAYTFSTGETLDTLRISGMVLGAKDLEPQQSMIVGITQNLEDSAFTKLPLLRVAKTDDRGRFTIRGLKPGKYRIYALGDKDNDYKYANPEEDIAFYDFVIEPTAEIIETTDTIYNKKTGEVDSVSSRMRTRFLPNDILLRSFNSEKRSQYLDKYERQDSTKVFLKFNTLSNVLPVLDAVGYPGLMNLAVLERNERNDSLVYWLPSELVGVDSLLMETRYLRTDSTGNLSEKIDSLKLFRLRPRATTTAKEASKKGRNNKTASVSAADSIKALQLGLSAVSSSTLDVYAPLHLRFDTPLARLDSNAFHLEMKVDTIWRKAPGEFTLSQRDSLSPRDFLINYDWKFGKSYKLTVDSLAATGIYGKSSGNFSQEFTIKEKDQYCSLKLNITGLDPDIPAFVQLLNSSDSPIRTEQVVNNTVVFKYLEPGKYYARIYEDFNGNGIYDPGNYDLLLQPDLVYYYPKVINIKKNWDKEESWDVFAMAIDEMKPASIKKNKPETDKRRRDQNPYGQEEEEDDDYFDPTVNPFDPNSRPRRPSY